LYLTTTTNGVTSTRSAYRGLLGSPIRLPKGFAADIAAVINSVMNLVMLVAALLVLMYLIWGAFDWLTSGGDKGKIDGARQKIMAAVVGLIILSASYAILLLAVRFLGFRDLNDVFENVQSIDENEQVFVITSATPSPRPSATPNYSDNLGEIMAR
jgi:ABC-type multidrug transport system fused ATPase/permease subunit